MGKLITWISRLLVGGLFIFSGIIKANDPHGFAYKLEEYFAVFGTEFLNPAAIYISIFICVFEIFLGVVLLIGLLPGLTTFLLLAMIVFFTFLTFYSAYFNVVTDCGCFGDFIKLTPWESFTKDVILLVLILILFINRKHISLIFKRSTAWQVAITALVLSILFPVYTYSYLPVWDFRPYNEGANIYEKMQIPEGESHGEYETTFIYKNSETGETKEFPLDNLPSDPWEFHDRIQKEIVPPYEPPIHDFVIQDNNGNDMTDLFLNQKGYRLVSVQYDLKKSDIEAQQELNTLAQKIAQTKGISFWALTASQSKVIQSYIQQLKVPYTFHISDATTLKTIIRSNPGLVLFKDNVVVEKWPSNNMPSISELEEFFNTSE